MRYIVVHTPYIHGLIAIHFVEGHGCVSLRIVGATTTLPVIGGGVPDTHVVLVYLCCLHTTAKMSFLRGHLNCFSWAGDVAISVIWGADDNSFNCGAVRSA